MTTKVLIVEDDDSVRQALRRALLLGGWEVALAAGGREALAAVATARPDVIVLDVAMPDVDGLEVARRLRADGDATPILMLTARVDVPERIAGLDSGADDYMLKPYDVGELQARLRALVRREDRVGATHLSFAELELVPEMRAVRVAGATVGLTRTEIDLLGLLMSSPRRMLTSQVIYDRVWGQEFGTDANLLRVYVGSLRRKLEAGGRRRLIHTVHGVGYVLREP